MVPGAAPEETSSPPGFGFENVCGQGYVLPLTPGRLTARKPDNRAGPNPENPWSSPCSTPGPRQKREKRRRRAPIRGPGEEAALLSCL